MLIALMPAALPWLQAVLLLLLIRSYSRNDGRSQSPSSSPFSTSSSVSSVNLRPSHNFTQMLADARDHHGTVLFADAAALDALARCADSLLNPHSGALVARSPTTCSAIACGRWCVCLIWRCVVLERSRARRTHCR